LLVGFAVFYMTLKLPYYAQAKGFYGLTAMACLCALGAWGFDRLTHWIGRGGVVLWAPLLVWALNAYVSFFVWPMDAHVHHNLGQVFSYQGKPERGIAHFRQALRRDPQLTAAYAHLGRLLSSLRRYAEAREALGNGLERAPDNDELANDLAWLLATCPQANVRDGTAALALAQQACMSSMHEHPNLLDTLAAAQAEAAQFSNAIKTLERAIRIAEAQKQTQLLPRLRYRLALYKASRPYRQSPERMSAR
jgi:tetratricopeptide (TPR) repeat protein